MTCGRDRTVRVWKLVDESHMLLRVPEAGERGTLLRGSLDCVYMIGEDEYVTGGEEGSLALWSINKKRPIWVGRVGEGRGVCCVGGSKGTDAVVSGGGDGFVRVWKLETRGLKEVKRIGMRGWVNGVQVGERRGLLACAVGREHRLGRWWCDNGVKNGVYIVRWKEGENGMSEEQRDSETSEQDEAGSSEVMTSSEED